MAIRVFLSPYSPNIKAEWLCTCSMLVIMDAAFMQPKICKISVHRRKELNEQQLDIMRALFIRTREIEPHYRMKAEERGKPIVQYLSDKFTKSIESKQQEALYFFILTSAPSSLFLSFWPSTFANSKDPDRHDLIGFTIAERVESSSVYVSRTTIDPRVQNVGWGRTMAGSLKEYFEEDVIWGWVNEKQMAVRRFWEVLGAKMAPASAVQVSKTLKDYKDYVIYAYRAKL
eukprot:Phypoly_transcript_11192.p1 GENE.Phypoly_transcript_11192~~Phypoly_transcript_11192.p1  ORF type:complete len:230 (+),score=26.49 Phypoly_transcript_11192:506-1195(+)